MAEKARINVAHFIHGLGLGGAQQVIKFIVERQTSGTFLYFVYSPEAGIFRDEVHRAGATVRIIPRRLRKFDPFWIIKLSRTLRRDGIDLLHCHLFGDSLHGYLSAKAVGDLPVVMTLHCDFENQSRLHRSGYRWLIPRCTRTVACSHFVRRSFVSAIGSRASEILTIPNGIEAPAPRALDTEARRGIRRELGLDRDTCVIASIGRMVEQKAQHHLISAFAKLVLSSNGEFQLLFLGDGPWLERLRRQADSEGLGDRVVFAGFRPNINSLLPVIDVVAFSSIWEGLSIAMLEAMAAARCIVGTDAAGIVEAVRKDEEALIVPTGDVAGLSAALKLVTINPALRRELGDAARRRYLRVFTADRMVQQYEALYQEIHAASNRSASPAVLV